MDKVGQYNISFILDMFYKQPSNNFEPEMKWEPNIDCLGTDESLWAQYSYPEETIYMNISSLYMLITRKIAVILR